MPENDNSIRWVAMMGTVREVLACESGDTSDQDSLLAAAERVIEKLRSHLSKSIGQEGFRTLLIRALSLTKASHPLVGAISIGADGSLIGLRTAVADRSDIRSLETQQDYLEGAMAIIANLLNLLSTLIGDDLTLRILSTVWTELALDGATGWENQRT